MALINNAMPKQAAPKNPPPAKASPEPTGAAPSSPGAAGEEQATPQEQDAYERVVLAGMKIMYDQTTHAGIVNMLRGGGDPAEALASTVATIMVQLDKKAGGKIPEAVILPAAADLLGEAAQLANAAKIFQVDERVAGKAMQLLIVKLAEEYGVAPEDVQALMQSMPQDQIKQMVAQQQSYNQQAQPAATAATGV